MIFHRIKLGFRKKGVDKAIYASVFVLAVFGIIMIGSASVGSAASLGSTYAIKNMATQTVYVLGGALAMLFLAKVFDKGMITYKSSRILYVICLLAMCSCFLFKEVNGAKAWIRIGSITIQPAEFMKLAMILILSYFLTETDSAFVVKGKFRTEDIKSRFYRRKFVTCVLYPIFLIGLVGIVGIFLQHDLGTTMILMIVCFVCFMVTPRSYYKKYKKLAWIFIGAAAVILIFAAGANMQGYQLARFSSWLEPLDNIYNNSWQLVNSLIAFANGGLIGRGFNGSLQKYEYIPESHNDFIGAIIYEELGMFGLALIVIPTCIIVFRLLNYADKIEDSKSRVILIGIATYFLVQMFINLGGISGLIPMTGVPLLLVSAGGSSTVCAMMAIGVAQSIIAKYNAKQLVTRD